MSGSAPVAPARAQGVVRRIIVVVLLDALITVAAVGLTGLVQRALPATTVAADDSDLARFLAFAFIAGPLAGVLWWWQRRKLSDPVERASVLWAVYVLVMSLTALVTATISLGVAAVSAIGGDWEAFALASGLVWTGVWVWHAWIRRSPRTAPTRLAGVTTGLSAAFGLAVAMAGAITALAAVVDPAVRGWLGVLAASQGPVVSVLQALVWVVLGGAVWWWHWYREGARSARDGFAGVLLVVIVGAAALVALVGAGTVLHVLLRMLFDTEPRVEILRPLGRALGAALVGGIVWLGHAEALAARSEGTRRAARLVISGIGLVAAASGFGILVNALLAEITRPLVGTASRSLLLAGISALVVGLALWLPVWRGSRPGAPGRRVYLVAIFGASAVVAIVTLLTIGYRIFAFVLEPSTFDAFIERIRAPFGLLAATAIVFGYHFAVWRRERAEHHAEAPQRAIGRIILVGGDDADAAAAELRTRTGAPVAVWRSAPGASGLDAQALAEVATALEALAAPRVLVASDRDGRAVVIPLAD